MNIKENELTNKVTKKNKIITLMIETFGLKCEFNCSITVCINKF